MNICSYFLLDLILIKLLHQVQQEVLPVPPEAVVPHQQLPEIPVHLLIVEVLVQLEVGHAPLLVEVVCSSFLSLFFFSEK